MTLGFWIIAAQSAEASDYDVGAGRAYRTVGAAVAQATADPGDGHTVRIFDAGPYFESVTLTEAMTVRGEGVVPRLVSTHPDGGFFTVSAPGAAVAIESVELDGEGENRVLLVLAGDVSLTDAVVHDAANTGGPGGAVLLAGGPADRLTVTTSSFTDCRTLGVYDGGAIAAQGGDLVVRWSTFEGGTVRDDGAHIATVFGYGSNVVLEDSVLRHGVANDGGGSLYFRDGDITIRRCLFEGNAALDEGGGAFQSESTVSLLVEDSTFRDNESFGGGGAIYQIDGVATYRRNVFCDNRSLASGGALHVDGSEAIVENSVFIGNSAVENGGAAKVKHATLTFRHNSLAANGVGYGGQGQALVSESMPGLVVTDSWFGEHPAGTEAVVSLPVGAATVSTSGWWANVGGTWNADVIDLGGHVVADALIPPPPPGACDALLLRPPLGSPLEDAASDVGAIGAFGGPNTWPDDDGDGWLSLQDCDDQGPTSFPGAAEIAADGIDQDCDLGDVCYADTDGDGFGDPDTRVPSIDLVCTDDGEAAQAGESCEGSDDALDVDQDGVPDGCDLATGGDDDDDDDAVDPGTTPGVPRPAGPRSAPAGCGCGTGSPAGLPLILALSVLFRRRRG